MDRELWGVGQEPPLKFFIKAPGLRANDPFGKFSNDNIQFNKIVIKHNVAAIK